MPVSAAAAALRHDPAIFLRTDAHLYPRDVRAGTDAMDFIRSEVITEPLKSAGDRQCSPSREKTPGHIVRPQGSNENAPDLHFRVGLPGFEPGTS